MVKAMEESYAEGVTDEFIKPISNAQINGNIEEEGHVCILLSLGGMQLLFALCAEVFAQGVAHVFFGEEDVHPCKRCVIGGHAVVLQVGNGVHSFLGHILLCEHLCEFLGTVVAEVHEDNHITLLDCTVNR